MSHVTHVMLINLIATASLLINTLVLIKVTDRRYVIPLYLCIGTESDAVFNSGGSRPGPGGLDPLTFCPGPQFFHRLLIFAAPHSALGARPPKMFWLEPPPVFNLFRIVFHTFSHTY